MIWSLKIKALARSFSLLLICVAPVAQADTVVFAAASLRGVLDEISETSGHSFTISYAGSGTIARQVAQGAPADVVILAHPRWMIWLQEQNVIAPDAPKVLAGNALVVIGQTGSAPFTSADDLPMRLGVGRLAMGQRDAVPAGIYAKAWLEHAGLWNALNSRLAETDNVRAALAFVARGETPLGIVYASDAKADPAVAVLWNVPTSAHPAIRYPAAALTDKGRVLMPILHSAQAQAIFAKHGFTLP